MTERADDDLFLVWSSTQIGLAFFAKLKPPLKILNLPLRPCELDAGLEQTESPNIGKKAEAALIVTSSAGVLR